MKNYRKKPVVIQAVQFTEDHVAACYRKPVEDLTVRVDHDEERDSLPIIVQLASGGEPGRSTKEALRRAVCRLVMEHCHRNAMEVSISVG